MANWIQNCQICNDGLCIRMEELKKTNLSERQAAEVMMEEALELHPELKEEFSADKIRMRYRYHMNGKKVEEFLPIMPAWPMCKKCGQGPVLSEFNQGSIEPAEHGLCRDCNSNENREQKPDCRECGGPIHRTVYSHGLCETCRKKELRKAKSEDADKRLEERQKEIDLTPVDTKTEEFWTDLIEKFGTITADIQVDDAIPFGKVEDETLDKIKGFRHQLFNLYGYLDKVIEQSEVKVWVQ